MSAKLLGNFDESQQKWSRMFLSFGPYLIILGIPVDKAAFYNFICYSTRYVDFCKKAYFLNLKLLKIFRSSKGSHVGEIQLDGKIGPRTSISSTPDRE